VRLLHSTAVVKVTRKALTRGCSDQFAAYVTYLQFPIQAFLSSTLPELVFPKNVVIQFFLTLWFSQFHYFIFNQKRTFSYTAVRHATTTPMRPAEARGREELA